MKYLFYLPNIDIEKNCTGSWFGRVDWNKGTIKKTMWKNWSILHAGEGSLSFAFTNGGKKSHSTQRGSRSWFMPCRETGFLKRSFELFLLSKWLARELHFKWFWSVIKNYILGYYQTPRTLGISSRKSVLRKSILHQEVAFYGTTQATGLGGCPSETICMKWDQPRKKYYHWSHFPGKRSEIEMKRKLETRGKWKRNTACCLPVQWRFSISGEWLGWGTTFVGRRNASCVGSCSHPGHINMKPMPSSSILLFHGDLSRQAN